MRLTSLDVYRGIAIASMILVNNPGSWSAIYPPLRHAEWHGCTPTDLVFPSFLFIAGVAMAFSLQKYIQPEKSLKIESEIDPIESEVISKKSKPGKAVYWRIFRRCVLLFALGLFLNGFSVFLDWFLNGAPISSFSNIRIMGVLQRISLAYFLAAIAILNLSRKQQWILAIMILIGYWAALTLIPVPGFGAGDLSRDGNVVAYINRLILNQHDLSGGSAFDPESLFSTLPAVVTVLVGYFTGDWLRRQPIATRTSLDLLIVGLCCLLIGKLWDFIFPINKQLWTSSYVIFTAGWALLFLAACYEMIEVRGWRRWTLPFEMMGLNAIFVFVASGFVARILLKVHLGREEDAPNLYNWIYQTLFVPWAGVLNGSLFFAIATVLIWGLILYFLYRRRLFFKI